MTEEIVNIPIINIPIINGDGDLQPFFSDIINERGLKRLGKNYNFVSIIGTQSTGKSTLLNKLFGTNFQTLNQSMYGRQQTTKGILLSKSHERDFFILDIEGSDSAHKWDNRSPFENSTALFALVLSQVLIINMFTLDVGKYVASNYGVLKVVLENNIKLFKQEGKKKLIFTLRDFSDDENLEKLTEILFNDINKIWSEIQKPKEYQNSSPELFFDIEIYPMRHYKYNKNLFETDVANLRDKFFNQNNEKYFFKDHNNNLNIPMDGLFLYIEKIWGTIKDCKDINLPSQKTMISTLRCSDIKHEVLIEFEGKLNTLKENVKAGPYMKFGLDANEIITHACEQFMEQTSNYENVVAQQKKQELIAELVNVIGEALYEQTTLIKKNLLDDLREKLSEIKVNPSKVELLQSDLSKLRQDIEEKFINYFKATDLAHFDAKIKTTKDECKGLIDDQLLAFREKQINIIIKKQFSKQKRIMEGTVSGLFNDLDLNFWSKLNEEVNTKMRDIEELIQTSLCDGFNLNPKSLSDQVENEKDEFKKELEIILRDKFQELGTYAFKKFKTLFNKGSNGLPINWKSLTGEEIGERYKKIKKEVEDIFAAVRHFETKTGYLDLDKEVVMSEKAIENSFHKLQDEFKHEYEEAVRKNQMSDFNGIPRWLWGIMAYFMYDDVFDMMKTPILFYPIMLVVTIVVLCIILGHSSLPLSIAKAVYTMIRILLGDKLTKVGINL